MDPYGSQYFKLLKNIDEFFIKSESKFYFFKSITAEKFVVEKI